MSETQETLTYAGRRRTTRGALAYFYVDAAGAFSGYKKPLTPAAKIGAQILITNVEGKAGSFWTAGEKSPRVVGYLENDPRLLEWALEEKTHVATFIAQRQSKRIAAAGEDPLQQALQPVRAELARMMPDERVAAVGWIMNYLLSGAKR